MDKLDKIGWGGVRAELLESGFDPAQVAAAEEKIQGLIGVPADKLADALGGACPRWRPRWWRTCPRRPPRSTGWRRSAR